MLVFNRQNVSDLTLSLKLEAITYLGVVLSSTNCLYFGTVNIRFFLSDLQVFCVDANLPVFIIYNIFISNGFYCKW